MKYLLCRPHGGLNDNFCCIERCIQYCIKYDRILLIDTNYDNMYRFNFKTVFKYTNDENIITDSEKIKEIIINKNLTIYPNYVKDLYNYKLAYDYIIIADNKIKYEFNINKNYIEDIILYTFGGCDDNSYKLMKYLKLTDYYINDIIEKYNQIPKPYVSIHIRNTDYKCNYINFYNKNKEKIKNANIFLATDSIDAFNYFKSQQLKIYSFTELPDKNTPYHKSKNSKEEILLNTILDLFLLGLGNNFIIPEDNKGGYARLSKFLYENKNTLHNIIDNKIEKTKIIQQKIIQEKINDHTKKILLINKHKVYK